MAHFNNRSMLINQWSNYFTMVSMLWLMSEYWLNMFTVPRPVRIDFQLHRSTCLNTKRSSLLKAEKLRESLRKHLIPEMRIHLLYVRINDDIRHTITSLLRLPICSNQAMSFLHLVASHRCGERANEFRLRERLLDRNRPSVVVWLCACVRERGRGKKDWTFWSRSTTYDVCGSVSQRHTTHAGH